MSTNELINPEQWKVLFNATSAASAYVSTASGGGLEILKELFSASKFMMKTVQNSGGSGYGELVEAFLGKMKEMAPKDAKAGAVKYGSKDVAGIRAEAKQIVADGARAADSLPGGDGFKRWLLDMAREVAETKTGGMLGFGAKSVIDEKEQAALDELAELMGV